MTKYAQPSDCASFFFFCGIMPRDVLAQLWPVDNVDKWAARRVAQPPQAAALACSMSATKRSKR